MYNYGEGIGSYNEGRYQGYPYANPLVIDVPTVDAATAARWNNLPRRQDVTKKDEPVIYIDLPSSSSQSTVSQPNRTPVSDADSPQKVDKEETPVVYIDLPQGSGSDVADRRPPENDDRFVQDTIFYDPFKNRRIEVESSESDTSSMAGGTSGSSRPTRPTPPNTLNIHSPSRGYPSPGFSQPSLSSIMSKETSVYGSIQIPNDFEEIAHPEPPPAYSERDTNSTMTTPAPDHTPQEVEEQPRTQVITPEDNSDRKELYCAYCSARAQSLVIRQAGFATHVIAIFFAIIGLFPITIFIYCTDHFKYKNHYCKHCNEKIAYEIPILGQKLKYTSKTEVIE